MNKEDWNNIEEFIKKTLEIVRRELNQESIEGVEHYLNHDEYEMAFEGLFIEIMKLKKLPELDMKESEEVALRLKLDEESIFDANFWDKFKTFTTNNYGIS